MTKIKSLEDLQKFFQTIKTPIIGIGVTAFNRLGPEQFLDNYKIVCFKNSRELANIKKQAQVLCIYKEAKNIRKNTQGILKSDKAREFISKHKGAYLLLYMVSHNIAKVCRKNKWQYIGMEAEREYKIGFRQLLKKCNLPQISGEITNLDKLAWEDLQQRYKLFVLQISGRGGGKGTFFIFSKKDFVNAVRAIKNDYGNTEVIVTKFIKGYSPSITACVTRSGIVYTNPQLQITDIPEVIKAAGSGVFCGHDWSVSQFPETVINQIYKITKVIGKKLKKQKYKGIFGLDFVVDSQTNKVYPVECNPRLLGSMPTITMIQLAKGEIPIIGLHILEFIGDKYQLNIKKVNSLMQKPKFGAHINLTNKHYTYMRVGGKLRSGVYILEKGKLRFLRSGYNFADLKNNHEFLLVDGVPYRRQNFKPGERILRLITKKSIYSLKSKSLNLWAKKIIKQIYKELRLVPAKPRSYYVLHSDKKGKLVTYRKYKPKDFADVKKLNKRVGCGARKTDRDHDKMIKGIWSKYFKTGGYFWVAEEKGKIIGTIGIKFLQNGQQAKLKALYVDSSCRNRGIASQLINIAEKYADKHNRKSII